MLLASKTLRLKVIIFVYFMFLAFNFMIAQEQTVKELLGVGASFPYPLYSKWFDIYAKEFGIKVNYQSIGSGGGIRQLMNKTVDFGASDAYLSEEEIKSFDGDVLHIPTALGAVVIIYNLDIPTQIKLTPEVLVDIFLGKINNWQDKRIKEINPQIEFPNKPIIVIHRSDGSGTTFIFTDYLSKVSQEWKEKVGVNKSVNWPIGIGGKGNEGVAGSVIQLQGSIGYVELIYAEKNKLKYASIKNKAGNFIIPTIKSVTESADVKLPDDLRISITDTSAPEGYPISGFTWLLVFKEQGYSNRTFEKGKAIKELIYWCITDAQQYNESLMYAPLPSLAKEMAMKLVDSITYKGEPIK